MILPIALDAASREKLRQQKAEQQDLNGDAPQRWHQVLDIMSRETTGVGADACGLTDVVRRKAMLFSWQASRETLVAVGAGASVAFLCWGMPDYVGWRAVAFRQMLRRAQTVLVNDAVTAQEISQSIGRQPVIVPFYVDADYFTFSPMTAREDFLFCNGSNDRDPKLLLSLAEAGHRIVWLVNDAKLRSHYENRHTNLKLVSRISHAELRRLNQTCRAAIMPAARDAHCAGQTTGLEALATGAPLLISAGRTAGIFAGTPSVGTIDGVDANSWLHAIDDLSDQTRWVQRIEDSRPLIADRLSVNRVRAALARALGMERAHPRTAT